MKIPVYMDGEDGLYYQDELNRVLQQDLSDNGWQTPQQSTVNIAEIEPSMDDGTFWYDSDTHEVKFKVNGVIKVVQFV